jgi:septum formation protein
MLDLDGVALGKPADPAEAVHRWRQMRGRSGQLRTGHWLVDRRSTATGGTQRSIGAASVTTVHFADLSDAEIDAYVATGEPLRVAGSFTLDGRSAPFVDGVVGDHTNVIGLSLPLFRRLVDELGRSVVDFW